MKHNKPLAVLLVAFGLVLSALSPGHVLAQPTTPALSLDIEQVALFKNGLGFFVGQATCPYGQKTFRIALPAAPSHGTLWISYPPEVDLAGAVTREVESTETLDAVTIPELLQANIGRRVRLHIDDKDIVGEITHFAWSRESAPPNPYAPGGEMSTAREFEPWRRQSGGLVMIASDSGTLCIDPRMVNHVTFLDGHISRDFRYPRRQAQLEVRLNEPAADRRLTVTFLAKGVTWAPSYVVDITEEAKARVAAKALIVNEACELEDVAVQLVTGFPHLQFSDVVSPTAMKESLAQFLQALSRGESERGHPGAMYNVMSQSVRYAPGGMGGRADSAMPAYGAAEVGTVAEDLFLYPAGQVNLERNEVAYVPLFTESVPCEHVYQWDIPDYVDEQGRYDYSRRQQDDQQEEQEVWHSLRLTNTTQVPWTTAPGETVKNGIILGQDTLKYTPPGADGTLRITRAVGVKADQIEFETDRRRDAMQLYGNHYDLITVRGKLSVINTQSKAATLEITKTLSGEVKSTEPEAKQDKLAKGLRRMNGVMKLTWTIELAPASDKQIHYVYEVYVRR